MKTPIEIIQARIDALEEEIQRLKTVKREIELLADEIRKAEEEPLHEGFAGVEFPDFSKLTIRS